MAIKISVVIPTYNRTALLARCIDALTMQDFDKAEYELIVVTDGADDSTLQLMKIEVLYYNNNNIRFFSTPVKKGPAAARNAGWHHAKGELIVFTDDDCVPSATLLSSYWAMYKRQNCRIIALNGPVQVPVYATPTDYEKNTIRLETAEFITANCACSQAALQKVNGFDEAFAMAWREDSDLHFKLIETAIPVIRVPDAVVVHPARKAFFGVSLMEQKKSMYNALLFKKYPQLYRQRIGASPLWNYYAMILLPAVGFTALTMGNNVAGSITLITWAFMVIRFTARRLNGTSLSLIHITEMLITSMFIPFLSVYWTLYGAVKFKKLLL
jgi:glycosyltransferase involved in cell wall biosynthesis